MLHQLIDFAGFFTPVTVVASFIWGHSRGYNQGRDEGFNAGIAGLREVQERSKPIRGPNGKFVKKGAA